MNRPRMDDARLLQQYVETGSQDAFGQLVRRHVNLVFGAHLDGLDDRAVERRIDEAIAWFDERGLPFVWWVLPSSEPRDLRDRLAARGFAVLPGAMPPTQ